jgi:hypothetical protein
MKLWVKFASIVSGLGIAASQGFACSCGGSWARTAWVTAQKEAERSDVIFEATPERFKVQWNGLTAKSGDLIRIDLGDPASWESGPRVLITLRVKRVYKGTLGTTADIWTGMGGGDCGTHYDTGLDYLVYASRTKSGELAVSICSPGGWLGSNSVLPKLRYLRKEHPLPSDLTTLDYRTPSAVKRSDQEREEFIKRYTAATGQICGVVNPTTVLGDETKTVAFLPTIGYSPYWGLSAEVDRDGKFCSDRLGPGQYYLYFTRRQWHGKSESALYYPGVAEREKAKVVTVGAGQVSNLVFRTPPQKTYAVRGFVTTDEKTSIGKNEVIVMLISPDWRKWGWEKVDFTGSLPVPKTKYFNFGSVPPGRYIAFAVGPGPGWLTRIAEVDVTTHAKLIFLALKHTNDSKE